MSPGEKEDTTPCAHDWQLALLRRAIEDNWSWLLCCDRCGGFDEMRANNALIDQLANQLARPGDKETSDMSEYLEFNDDDLVDAYGNVIDPVLREQLVGDEALDDE